MSEKDDELHSRWRGGDRAAGAELIERHYDSVYRFFATKTGGDADDLVQRTFAACSDHDSGYRGDSSFRTYIFGVARNLLFAHYRGRSRQRARDPDYSIASAQELSPGPSTYAAVRVEYRLLVEALRRLPLEIQMTLELFYWEEMPMHELAEVLEIPIGTVKSRLHRGRVLLKEKLEKIPAPPKETASVRVLLDRWANQMQKEAGI